LAGLVFENKEDKSRKIVHSNSQWNVYTSSWKSNTHRHI